MKKNLTLALAGFMALAAIGCGGGATESSSDSYSASNSESSSSVEQTPPEVSNVKNLIVDSKFENGLHLRGLHAKIYNDPIENFCDIPGNLRESMINFDYSEKGYNTNGYKETAQSNFKWILHQAASRYPFNDVNNTMSSQSLVDGSETFNYRFTPAAQNNGVNLYENQSKTVGVNTSTGKISMLLKGSECYKYDRKYGEEWPHLVLLQHWGEVPGDFCYTNPEYALKNINSLQVKMGLKVDKFADNMGEDADTDIHSAICMYYILLGYKKPNAQAYSDFLYLGLTVFDNRNAIPAGGSFQDGNKESATNKWVYNINGTDYYDPWENNLWENGVPAEGKWANIDLELLPYIDKAFTDAQNGDCMKGATLDDLYVVGLYLGFELPGNYDLGMTFKDIEILTTLKDAQ